MATLAEIRRMLGSLFACSFTISITDIEIGYGAIVLFAGGTVWLLWRLL